MITATSCPQHPAYNGACPDCRALYPDSGRRRYYPENDPRAYPAAVPSKLRIRGAVQF